MFAAIEAVRDGLQFLLARTFRGLFGLDQFAEGHGHVRLPVHAGFDLLAAAGVDIPGGAAGVENGQRRLHDLLEAFGSVKFQQGDDRIDGARHGGCLDVTVRDSVLHVPGDGFGVARGFALSLEQLHAFLVAFLAGAVNENGYLASHAERTDIGYGERQQSGGAGIGGVSTLLQNLDAGRSGGRPT